MDSLYNKKKSVTAVPQLQRQDMEQQDFGDIVTLKKKLLLAYLRYVRIFEWAFCFVKVLTDWVVGARQPERGARAATLVPQKCFRWKTWLIIDRYVCNYLTIMNSLRVECASSHSELKPNVWSRVTWWITDSY